MKSVTLYTKSNCFLCTATKDLLNNIEVPYKELNMDTDPKIEKKVIRLSEKYNQQKMPMILIGKEFIGSYDELGKLQRSGKLGEILK